MKTTHNHKRIGIRKLSEFDASMLLGTAYPVILHDSVDQKYCIDCGEVIGHVIPNPEGLISVVSVLRASTSVKLNGGDIKFLRKSLKKKAKEFAEDIAISAEQLSRFENDKQPISLVYERLLRAAVFLGHFDEAHSLGLGGVKLFELDIPSVRSADVDLEFNLHLVKSEAKSKPLPNPIKDETDPPWRALAS